MNLSRRSFATACLVAASIAGFAPALAQAQDVTPTEAREIAKEAYIYGFPMVDSYRIQHAYFVDTSNPEYKTTWNQLYNTARLHPCRHGGADTQLRYALLIYRP